MTKWKVDILIEDINAETDGEYEAQISNITKALEELGYHEVFIGIGEKE